MQFRKITEEQAEAVLQILRDECGYCADPFNGRGFVRAIMTEASDREHVCHEYRFIGQLGFGGKFRNNGNNNNTPHVDCYSENESPQRLKMIDAANARLATLFNGSSP